MYDVAETDASRRYIDILVREFGDDIAIVGGWAVFFLVDERYRSATGFEYLRSRDVDLIISPKPAFVERFGAGIRTLGFVEGGLPFRYQLILERDNGSILTEKEAAIRETFDLVYIFLDVFSPRRVPLGAWVIPELDRALRGRRTIDAVPVAPPLEVLKMKLRSFGERENPEKREKDACDIYALLHYSGIDRGKVPADPAFRAIADVHSDAIAEALFRDRNYGGIVRRNLSTYTGPSSASPL